VVLVIRMINVCNVQLSFVNRGLDGHERFQIGERKDREKQLEKCYVLPIGVKPHPVVPSTPRPLQRGWVRAIKARAQLLNEPVK
jgi:hypothetical protein